MRSPRMGPGPLEAFAGEMPIAFCGGNRFIYVSLRMPGRGAGWGPRSGTWPPGVTWVPAGRPTWTVPSSRGSRPNAILGAVSYRKP